MTLKKGISVLLIASQVSFASVLATAAVADTAPSSTPEFTLVESLLALQGRSMSDQARHEELAQIMNTYESATADSASVDGRAQRLQTALVQLGVYTPAQAQAFLQDAQAADARVSDQNQSLGNEIATLAQLHPMGAQFSACEVNGWSTQNIGAVTAIAGGVATLVGLLVYTDNPSCHDVYEGSAYTCGYDSFDNYSCWYSNLYTTQCDQPGYHPYHKAGARIMIGGGIVTAIGALVYLVADQNC